MPKSTNNSHLAKSVNIPEIIKNQEAFSILSNSERRTLYKKMDIFFKPKKSWNYYKKMFLYPEQLPQNENTKFYIETMLYCLVETIHDSIVNYEKQMEHLNKIIPKFKSLIEEYEHEEKI